MSDWAGQAADSVEKVVVLVRDRAVVPAQKVSRGIVYGLLAAAFLVPALILVAIFVFRLLTYIPGGGAWLAYLILGGICVLGGTLCWAKRGPRLDLRE